MGQFDAVDEASAFGKPNIEQVTQAMIDRVRFGDVLGVEDVRRLVGDGAGSSPPDPNGYSTGRVHTEALSSATVYRTRGLRCRIPAEAADADTGRARAGALFGGAQPTDRFRYRRLCFCRL